MWRTIKSLNIAVIMACLAAYVPLDLEPVQQASAPDPPAVEISGPGPSRLTASPAPQALTAPAQPIVNRSVPASPAPERTAPTEAGLDSAFTRNLRTEGDQRQLLISDVPLNYLDPDGAWQPIDPRFEPQGNRFANTRNALQIYANATRGAIRAQQGRAQVGWDPREIILTDADGETILAQALATEQTLTGTLSADGRAIRYTHGWTLDTLSEEIMSGPGSVEHSLIFEERPQALESSAEHSPTSTLSLRASLQLLPEYGLRANGRVYTDAFSTDGELQIVNLAEQVVLTLPPAHAFEQAHARRTMGIAARYHAWPQEDGEWTVAIETPAAWWADPSRHYPVVLDPIIQVLRPMDYVTIRPGLLGRDTDRVEVGNDIGGGIRALVRFRNFPTLPPGYVIQKAELAAVANFGFFPTVNGTEQFAQTTVKLYRPTQGWDPNLVTWDNQPDIDPNPIDGSRFVQVPPYSYLVQNKDPYQLTGPYTAVKWTLPNNVVHDWLTGGANAGLELRSTVESACSAYDLSTCHSVGFISPSGGWVQRDLADIVTFGKTSGGGLMLILTYQAPQLQDGVPYDYNLLPRPPSPDGISYYRSFHAYSLPPNNGNTWTAIAVKGLMDVAPAQTPTGTHTFKGLFSYGNDDMTLYKQNEILLPQHPKAAPMPIGGCRTDSSLASLSCLNPDDGISSGEGSNTGSNYVLLSAAAVPNHEARVYPTTNDPRLKYYAVEAVRAKPLPALDLTQVFSTGYLFTQTFSISTTHIITAYSVNLPANTRVGIKLSAGIPSLNPRVEARLFGPGNGAYGKTQSLVTIPNNTRQRYTINPGQQGNYALVLEYASDVTVFNPDHGATITPSISTLSGRFTVLVCPIEAIPTEDGCQFMFKPHDIGQLNGTAYRDVGPYRVYSEGNFDPCNTTDECSHTSSGGRLYTPFVGWGTDMSRLVVVAGQPIQVNTAAPRMNLIYPSGDEGPIVLLGIDPPGYITRTFEAWVGTATAQFGGADFGFLVKDGACTTAVCANLLTPLLPKDVRSSHAKVNVQNSVSSPQYAQADTTLYRPIQIAMNVVQTATFTLDWKVHAEGYAGRPSYSADGPFDISLTLVSGPPTMDVASMTYTVGTSWSMDYDPTAGTAMFTNIRNQGKIAQDDKLGGAWKFVQFVIPKYQEMSGQGVGNGTCVGGYCNEVRAPEDTLYDAHRFWRMPDVKVEGKAQTVMLSRPGELQVFSSDHPGQGPYGNSPSLANTVLISQPFSFNGMNGVVKVEYSVCPDSANTDQVLVVRGGAKMAMPGIGSTEDATAMISTTFTLCELALREAGLYFHAEPGIPVGATGVNITGLKGLVKVGPDFTVVTVGVDFTVAKLVDAQVEVTVDTRGLFDIQGKGRIIALVDFVGHSWVAWNPLDVGVDLGIYFPKFKDKDGNEAWWIRGQIHGHVWKGQGWQHKYKWLPDNDDMHYAASILAEIKIKKGACCDIFGVPIPPFEVRYGVEVAFGQFCTNAQCTQYEDGVKGQVFILSFNIGVYYGFSTGFSFILGSDGHILIDQYQPKSAQALAYANERTSREPTVNGQPFAFDRQAVDNPEASSVTVPLTVTASTGSFMVGLTWARNAPTLTLMLPGSSVEISPSNALTYGVQYTGTSYYILYMVGNPAPGIWQGKISNATASDDYHLLFFANKKLPTVSFSAPSANRTLSNTLDSTQPFTYHVQWTASVTSNLKISLYYSATNAGALTTTQPYGGVISEDLPLSQGAFDWDMSYLGKGQYRVYAKVSNGPDVRPSVTGTNQTPGVLWVNAPGVLTYNDPTPPPAPTHLTLTPLDDAALACWDANPAHDVSGYLLNYNVPDVNGIYKLRALRVIATAPYTPTAIPARQCTRLGGLNSGSLVPVTLAAYDATGNLSGSTLSSVDIAPGLPDSAPSAGVLTGSVNSSYVVSLSWTGAPAGSSIAGYELFYADAFPAGPGRPGSGANQGNSPVRLGNILATTLTGLTHGRTFHFRVRAIDTESRIGSLSNDVALLLTNGVSTGGDGLPDDWKAAHHVTSATADNDCDGLTNAEEFARRAEPDVADTDGDGYTDGEEAVFGSDPLDRGILPASLAHLPRIGLSEERLSFRTYISTTAPAPQSVNVTNWSGGTLTPTLGTVSPWLNASLKGSTLQVSVNKSGLLAGQYGGTVEVKATGSRIIGCSAKLTVNLWLIGGVPPVGFYRVFLPIAIK